VAHGTPPRVGPSFESAVASATARGSAGRGGAQPREKELNEGATRDRESRTLV
jgi:hypothetical protein